MVLFLPESTSAGNSPAQKTCPAQLIRRGGNGNFNPVHCSGEIHKKYTYQQNLGREEMIRGKFSLPKSKADKTGNKDEKTQEENRLK